jgi:hypothetical protein
MPVKAHAAAPVRADIGLDQRWTVWVLAALSVAAMTFGVVADGPRGLLDGTLTILTSPSALLTDYFAISSVGATFFNAGLLLLLSVLLVRLTGGEFTGIIFAAFGMVVGFAFFGKNLLGTVPITVGVLAYAKVSRRAFRDLLPEALFGTALAPAVSYTAFGLGLGTVPGMGLALGVGLAIGLVIPPLAARFRHFHHGLNLYNVGFTAGIVGMVVLALFNVFGHDVGELHLVSDGHTRQLALVFGVFCLALLISGWGLARRAGRNAPPMAAGRGGLARIMRQSGKAPDDFIAVAGCGPALMNMGLVGLLALGYVLVVGGDISGPVLGGLFTIAGFGAYGKHPRNVWPILAGVAIAAWAIGIDLASTDALLAALFGTTLAPIAGVYGWGYGIVAGFLHMALVANVGLLHGGLNLYNNGFAAGFVAIILYPLFHAKLRVRGKPAPPIEADPSCENGCADQRVSTRVGSGVAR